MISLQLTQELRELRQERIDAAAVTTRQLTHLMRQMTPSLRDQFMTETLASALRYVDLSRQQTQQLPLQQLPYPPGLHDPSTPNAQGTAAATTVCPGPRHGPSTGTATESPHH